MIKALTIALSAFIFLTSTMIRIRSVRLFFLILGLLLLLSEVHPLSGLSHLLDGGDGLGDQFLHPSEFDLKGEGVLLGDVDDLVDDELLIREQFGSMQGLADDLQHVDVGKR